MIEETAQVVRVENASVWVETLRRSTCSGCAAENGCGSAALSKVLGRRRTVIRVLSDLPLRAGDRVVIGIAEQALVRGSLAVYAVPLLLLLLGAVAGEMGAARGLWIDSEIASATAGLTGLAAGLLWLRRFTRNIQGDHRYQPVVLRRLGVLTDTGMGIESRQE
jgi:sigma-E factor negative regulatory protein RseC